LILNCAKILVYGKKEQANEFVPMNKELAIFYLHKGFPTGFVSSYNSRSGKHNKKHYTVNYKNYANYFWLLTFDTNNHFRR